MINSAYFLLHRSATARYAILLWVIFIGLSVVIFNFGYIARLEEHAQGNIILDNTFFFYTVDYVNQLFTTYGEEGRSLYLLHLLTFDFIYPILFFVTNAVSLICLLNYLLPAAKITRHLHLLPLAPAMLDYLENFGILLLLAAYPNLHPWVVAATSLITMIKLSLVNILFLLTVAIAAGAAIKFVHQKIKQ
ncbi:MAG: hypothetical protein IPG44_08585 [Anaerolineales bacterium]|jgi:hypothetical protein|nr:hypothetical protein [Chloroflexota bacterium]MBK6645798.1 hypothetical protein [Anaerolineales bacterium]